MFSLTNPDLTGLSIVRMNLLTRQGYSGYCGAASCIYGMPRTSWNGTQFQCRCGFKTRLDIPFMMRYIKRWNTDKNYLTNRVGLLVVKTDPETFEDIAMYKILSIRNNLMELQKLDLKSKRPIPYLIFTLDIYSMHDYHIVGVTNGYSHLQ